MIRNANQHAKVAALSIIAIALLTLGLNCTQNSPGASVADVPTAVPATSGQLTVTELSSQTETVGPDAVVSHLLKITSSQDTGLVKNTYAQWIPSPVATGAAPAVLVTAPYDGINWSRDPIDLQWSSNTNGTSGTFPDTNGPGYTSGISKPIAYFPSEPGSYAKMWYPLLKSGIGILVVYGRFYAGGDFNTYLNAVRNGLDYLATQSKVDPERVGIFGISLGGFEALYGSATSNLKPKYGIAWSPLSDVVKQKAYIANEPNQIANPTQAEAFKGFFEPYLRRVPTDLASLTKESLIPRLNTHFLIFHDDWDMLTPSTLSHDFVSMAGAKAEALWFPHLTPINHSTFALDHQQTSEGISSSMGYLFSYAYFQNRLLASSSNAILLGYYSASDSTKTFAYFRAQQQGGNDIRSLTSRLVDLCDPRIYLLEMSGGTGVTGPAFVASILQTHWGIAPGTVNENTVRAYLQQNGLPN